MWVFVSCLIALLVVGISHWIYQWSNPKCKNGKLPPGSMGLPIVGETFEFFSSHSFYDIPPFITKRMARYGSMFRTSILGQNIIVSTDPDINYSIFQQENQSFMLWYTESFNKIMGENSLIQHHGNLHKYLKNLILHVVGYENLRAKLLPEMNETARRHLHLWANHGSVDIKHGAAQMIFETFAKNLISYEETKYSKKLMESFKAFMDGLLSFPVNIPGTAFHACLQGRKRAIEVIKDIYQERKASKITRHDFLDLLLEQVEKENMFINDTIALDLIFVLLFASYETTSEAITLLTKFIFDHPHVLTELTKEHEAILRGRDNNNNYQLTWEEYQSMTFTHMVINETIRLGNIAPMFFRKVVKDVEINGYTIPAGWTVMVVPSVVHFDPDKYDDPLVFNPWRWKGQKLHVGSKTFMAFGGGVRLCVGADFAKLQMAVFLHYLVTSYRWSAIKGGDIIRKPGLVFPDGLHIEIAKNDTK